MKYTIAVQAEQFIEMEAESAEAAIEAVKTQMDPRVAAAAAFQVVTEAVFDEASQSYIVPLEQNEKI